VDELYRNSPVDTILKHFHPPQTLTTYLQKAYLSNIHPYSSRFSTNTSSQIILPPKCLYAFHVSHMDFSALKMEVACSSKTVISTCKTRRCHNQDEYIIKNHLNANLKTYKEFVSFEVFTMYTLKIVFCDVTSCSLLDIGQNFGKTWCLHFQSRKWSVR
jgi:hypothetical protein